MIPDLKQCAIRVLHGNPRRSGTGMADRTPAEATTRTTSETPSEETTNKHSSTTSDLIHILQCFVATLIINYSTSRSPLLPWPWAGWSTAWGA